MIHPPYVVVHCRLLERVAVGHSEEVTSWIGLNWYWYSWQYNSPLVEALSTDHANLGPLVSRRAAKRETCSYVNVKQNLPSLAPHFFAYNPPSLLHTQTAEVSGRPLLFRLFYSNTF